MEIEAVAKDRKYQRSFCLLATAFAVTVVALLLVFILLWLLVPRPYDLHSASTSAATPLLEVCNSEACVSASALLQRSVDLFADPCHDFYSFACGGFERRTPYDPLTIDTGISLITQEAAIMDAKVFELFYKPDLARSDDTDMNSMYQAVRQMFMSCIAWHNPSTWWLPHKPNSLWNLTTKDSKMKPRDFNVLFEPLIRQLDNQTSLEDLLSLLVRTQTSGLILLSRDLSQFLINMRLRGPVLSFDTVHFGNVIIQDQVAFVQVKQFCNNNGMLVTSNFEEVVATLRIILNSNTSFFKGTLLQLQQETDRNFIGLPSPFNWTKFIVDFYDGPLSPEIPISISNFGNFVQALQLLSNEVPQSGRRPLHDIIRIEAVMSIYYSNFFYQSPEKFSKAFVKEKVSDKESSLRKNRYVYDCMRLTITSMLPLVHAMFKEAYVKDDFAPVHSLIKDVKNGMKLNVDDESWIRNRSKNAIKEKIDSMKSSVSFRELPASEIKSLFRKPMQMFGSTKTFGDVLLTQKDAAFRLQLWFQTANASIFEAWEVLEDPFQINAFYYYYLNKLYLLMGIISLFQHYTDQPQYLPYGGIGFVIGHEMGHGFDQSGVRFGGNETMMRHLIETLLDPETLSVYRNKSECLIHSYNGQSLVPNSRNVDGTATLEENFSDIVGINAAFRAYKASLAGSRKPAQLLPGPLGSRLTPDQLFFVQSAQMHCGKIEDKLILSWYAEESHSPPRARLIGTMQHSKDFARAFDCKADDKMFLSDVEKCHFW